MRVDWIHLANYRA